jgi:hypothetical protein
MFAHRTLLTTLAVLGLAVPAAHAAPLNDHFANAKALPSGSKSTTTYDLAGATKQAGEPSAGSGATGHTAWFRWTPTATGGASVTTCADATDHEVIEVYTGTTLADLTPVVEKGVTGCKPDDIRFIAHAGTAYWIQADYDVSSPGPAHPGTIRVDQRTALPETTLVNWPDVTGREHAVDMAAPPAGVSYFYTCTLDGEPLAACNDGDKLGFLKPLTSGKHTFTARASDDYGNVEAQPAARTWTVDATGPTTSIVPPASPSRTSTPTFTFTAEPGATFACRVGGAGYEPCSSPHRIAPVADGFHVFAVRAIDGFGNVGAPQTQAFRVDTTTPPPGTPGPGFSTPPVTTATTATASTSTTSPVTTPVPGLPCRPRVSAVARITRSALRRRGLAVRIAVATRCRTQARLLAGGRTVARGAAVIAAGAPATVRLRARRRPAGRLVLHVVATDAGGRRARATRRIVVR